MPQTFTITIEQAGFLAQMKAGQRSSWVRSAIDSYRRGPIALQKEMELYEGIVDMMNEFLEERLLMEEYLKFARESYLNTSTRTTGLQQPSEDGAEISGNEVRESSDE